MKVIKIKDDDDITTIKEEIITLGKLSKDPTCKKGISCLYRGYQKDDEIIIIMEYIEGKNLQQLLEKQRVLYTRMSLSDDPEAKEMKDKIIDSAKMMGLEEGMDISYMFGNMEKLLESLKEEIDKQS